ncbi:hypothetical protein ES703_13509 [subsurface metagenome]
MQWLINIVTKRVLANFQHIITMWFKPIADIPAGWGLCDGTQGLPDLREKFIKGCAVGIDPGGTGGSVNHIHSFTSQPHDHEMELGNNIAEGEDYEDSTSADAAYGETDTADGQPPHYEMVFIGKL